MTVVPEIIRCPMCEKERTFRTWNAITCGAGKCQQDYRNKKARDKRRAKNLRKVEP